jgi:transposase-like protein
MLTQDYTNCRHEFTVGNGVTTSGSKRVECTFCRKRFTPNPKRRTSPLTDKEIRAITQMAVVERRNQRTVAKELGLSRGVVQKYASKIRRILNAPDGRGRPGLIMVIEF